MKKLFFAIVTITSMFFVNAQQANIKNVSSTDFNKLTAKKDGVIIDVRTLSEFEDGHLKEAAQLNYYAWSFKENLLLLPKDKPIYVYCKTGYRSKNTAKILIENGYKNIFNLENGIKEWEQNNFPIVKGAKN